MPRCSWERSYFESSCCFLMESSGMLCSRIGLFVPGSESRRWWTPESHFLKACGMVGIGEIWKVWKGDNCSESRNNTKICKDNEEIYRLHCFVFGYVGMSPRKVSKHDLIYLKMVPSEWFQVMMLASTLASSEEALLKPCCSLYSTGWHCWHLPACLARHWFGARPSGKFGVKCKCCCFGLAGASMVWKVWIMFDERLQ